MQVNGKTLCWRNALTGDVFSEFDSACKNCAFYKKYKCDLIFPVNTSTEIPISKVIFSLEVIKCHFRAMRNGQTLCENRTSPRIAGGQVIRYLVGP